MPTPSFDLLDRHVVSGHADDDALLAGPVRWSYARLLEEVSAFGGVLRHCGVRTGDRVGVLLPESPDLLVAVLACARIGARHVHGALDTSVVVTDSAAVPPEGPEVVLVRQRPGAERELRADLDHDWAVVMRAGRTDPAPCREDAVLEPADDREQAWVDALRAGRPVHLPA